MKWSGVVNIFFHLRPKQNFDVIEIDVEVDDDDDDDDDVKIK